MVSYNIAVVVYVITSCVVVRPRLSMFVSTVKKLSVHASVADALIPSPLLLTLHLPFRKRNQR